MDPDTKRRPITTLFNISLTCYLIFVFLGDYLFSPEKNEKVPWDLIYDINQLFGIIGAFLIIFSIIFLGSYFVFQFWNRFISDVFKLRQIVYQEAFALTLFLLLFATP